MNEEVLKLLTTEQLLEHAITVTDELRELVERPELRDVMDEKRIELILVTEEIVKRIKQP